MCTLVSKNPLGLLRCQHIQEQQDWQVGYRAAMKARIDESEQEWELICPLLSGPETMIVWTTKGTTDAIQEAQAGRDRRQAA